MFVGRARRLNLVSQWRMTMAKNAPSATWLEDTDDIIVLTNRSKKNFILELPTGRCRLDAGRKLRTMRSILTIAGVQKLVDDGELTVEKS
jgi:hypothetical protein